MAVKAEDYSNVCVIMLEGDVTAEACQQIRATVDERVEQRRMVDFVIDFEKVDFIDSEGLETLLWLKRRSEDLFGQIKLVNLKESVHKILEITRLEHRFECHADLAGALKTMR
jgi:anti-anti-sigma factor